LKILAKFPTRGRPQRFLQTLHGWIEAATNPRDITFLVSYDHDDDTMTPPILAATQGQACEVRLFRGASKSKIEAINANVGEILGWDILLVISDDFFCRRKGWDDFVRQKMTQHFPDTDGSLWIYDGSQKKINTLPCLGWKYYQRIGFIYNPEYKSFFCDNEQTEIGMRDGKLAFIDEMIATHEHPAWGGGMKIDELYQRNNKYWPQDHRTYERRKAAGFPA
jgi:hypothetical protein